MTLGSIFSGGGLGDFGWLAAGFEIKWQIEIDDYCQKILELRFPKTKKYRNAKEEYRLEAVDVIAGGPPCQPFSIAGKQRGAEDNRNLWPTMFKVIKKVRPPWVVVENVSGIINIYLDTILFDLEGAGYSCRTFVFPAHALGALHRRERIWVVGYSRHNSDNRKSGEFQSESRRCEERSNESGKTFRPSGGKRGYKNLAYPRCEYGKRNTREMETNKTKRSISKLPAKSSDERFKRYWSTEPSVGRVVNGCPRRVDRLKVLGNGQVPINTFFIGECILEFERQMNEKL